MQLSKANRMFTPGEQAKWEARTLSERRVSNPDALRPGSSHSASQAFSRPALCLRFLRNLTFDELDAELRAASKQQLLLLMKDILEVCILSSFLFFCLSTCLPIANLTSNHILLLIYVYTGGPYSLRRRRD